MIISQALAAATEHAGEHSIFQDPTFWVGIAFCITVLAIIKLAGKTISDILQSRTDKIASKLEEASKLHEEAERLLAEYTTRHATIGQTTKQALAEAELKAQNLKENIQKEFEEKLKNREEVACQRLDRAGEEALEEVRNLAVEIAMQTVERLLSEKLSEEEGQKLIDEAIDSLPQLFSKENAA